MISVTRETFVMVTCVNCIIASVALLANGAVMLAFIKSKQLQRPTNYFAVNLAVADTCIIIGPWSCGC